jgi:hypothetical protein
MAKYVGLCGSARPDTTAHVVRKVGAAPVESANPKPSTINPKHSHASGHHFDENVGRTEFWNWTVFERDFLRALQDDVHVATLDDEAGV